MENPVRLASKPDIPALCEIWKSCFINDSEEYIEYFYKENFDSIKTYIYCSDGRPVSMVHIFDAVINDGNISHKAMYAYAGGTLPGYRHNGYFEAVMRHVQNTAVSGREILFFKPAPHLISYYQFLGCVNGSFFRIVTFSPEEKQPYIFTDISDIEYNRLRDSAFSGTAYVKWSDDYIRWCIDENAFFSGRTLKTAINGKEHFILLYPEDDMLVVNETDMSLSELKQVGSSLCKLFDKKQIKAYMPDSCEEGEETISSLIYNSELRNYYTNLILI
jgi:hypothetical protein